MKDKILKKSIKNLKKKTSSQSRLSWLNYDLRYEIEIAL